MTEIRVARPFALHHPAHGHGNAVRYAIGVHDVDDAIAAHPYVIAHCEAAVVAAGGALVQHRPLPHTPSSAGSNVFASSMQLVSSIEANVAGGPIIEYWPPGARVGHTTAGVEPPPVAWPPSAQAYDYYFSSTGKLFQLRPVDDTGAPLGDWQPAPPTPRGRMIVRPPDIIPDPEFERLQRIQRAGAVDRQRGWKPAM